MAERFSGCHVRLTRDGMVGREMDDGVPPHLLIMAADAKDAAERAANRGARREFMRLAKKLAKAAFDYNRHIDELGPDAKV